MGGMMSAEARALWKSPVSAVKISFLTSTYTCTGIWFRSVLTINLDLIWSDLIWSQWCLHSTLPVQYYIRIGDYVREPKSPTSKSSSHIVRYSLLVISRDGTSWELTKSLADFYSFWMHLPFGMGLHSKLHLKTGFPLWKLNSLSLKTMVLGSFRSQMTDNEVHILYLYIMLCVYELHTRTLAASAPRPSLSLLAIFFRLRKEEFCLRNGFGSCVSMR